MSAKASERMTSTASAKAAGDLLGSVAAQLGRGGDAFELGAHQACSDRLDATPAAERGDELFSGKAACNICHVEPLFTEPGWNMHTPAEVCVDDFQANRSPDERYRTSPLRGLWTHQKGGFFHDGRFATLLAVVDHYNTCFNLGLTEQEKSDVAEYLKSL